MNQHEFGIAIVAAAILLAFDGLAGIFGTAWKNNKFVTQYIRLIFGVVFALIGAFLIYR
jgi:uncharacterized membrane protein